MSYQNTLRTYARGANERSGHEVTVQRRFDGDGDGTFTERPDRRSHIQRDVAVEHAVQRGRIAEEDAVPVARARAAGLGILGKTNLPELAAAIGTTNTLFPPTQNPWRHGFTPGGSRGGSGAAVAA